MPAPEFVFALLLRKLRSRAGLNEADEGAIRSLRFRLRIYEAHSYIVREGNFSPDYCSFILSGLAFRQKVTAAGARQILSLNLPGDFVDLQHLFLKNADHSVQALSRIEVIDIDRADLQKLAKNHPNIGEALWIDSLIEASIFREWLVNIGRRDARTRIAHFLCEYAVRMQQAGIAHGNDFTLPMTQEQIGDALGLTGVHVNRTLKALAKEGAIERHNRHVTFGDWENLRKIAGFSAQYLHQDQIAPLH